MTPRKAQLLSSVRRANSAVEPVGIDFDGANDYLSRSSDLVGNSDGKTFTFSAWVYVADSTTFPIYTARSGGGRDTIEFDLLSGRRVQLNLENSSSIQILDVTTPSGSLQANTWYHILASWDLSDTAKRHLYINDADGSPSWNTYTNADCVRTVPSHYIGHEASGDDAEGRLAHVYLDYTYRDLSVEANRRNFITADLKPANGQAALNPILYLPMDDPTSPGLNLGTGGDFALNGVIARSGRGPNQYNAAASTFDGTADYLSRASALSGISSSKTVTFSARVKFSVSSGNILMLEDTVPTYRTKLRIQENSGSFQIVGENSSGTIIFFVSGGSIVTNKWQQIDLSIDLSDTGKRHFLVDGSDVSPTWTTYTNDLLALDQADRQGVGANGAGGTKINGELSDLWFDTTYIDLSTSNPFYDTETGKPKDLGVNGELPTGSAPLIYLPLRADNAGKNMGTGGDFTVNSGPYVGARGPSEFWGESAEFDGTSQYLQRTSALTGAADSKTFSVALAFRFDAGAESNLIEFYDGSNNYFAVAVRDGSPSDRIQVSGGNALGSFILSGKDESSITLLDGNWYTVLISCDMSDTTKRHLYLDGAIPGSLSWGTYTDDSIAFTDSTRFATVTNLGSITDYFDGKIGFLWFNTEYIDFSQEANRLKFFDAFGYPVDVGADGSLPTGNVPLIYMNKGFHQGTNLGSGGDFTPQNTPTDGGFVKG